MATISRRIFSLPPTTRQVLIATATAIAAGGTLYGARQHFIKPAFAEEASPRKSTFGSIGFRSLQVESVERVNHDTRRVRFALPDGEVSGLKLTNALLSMSWPTGRWTPVFRPYTPVSDLDDPGHIDLMVKRYPDGKQSTHIHSLKIGDTLTFFGFPLPGYKWQTNERSHVLLLAGGAGITPIYQLAKGILTNPNEKTKITLVWGTNTDKDVFLKEDFDELRRQFPDRFSAHYTVSRPSDDSHYRSGRVTSDFLKDAMTTTGFSEAKDGKVFLCGPPAMEEAVAGKRGSAGILEQLGFNKDQVHRF